MRKNLFALFLMIFVVTGLSQGAYVMSLHYSNGDITLNNVTYEPTLYASGQLSVSDNYYGYELWDHNGTLIDNLLFDVPNEILIDTETGGEIIILDELDFVLLTDYHFEGENIMFYNSSEDTILDYNVSRFSSCNQNLVCDTNENVLTCPSDCEIVLEEGDIPDYLPVIALLAVLVIVYFAFRRK